MSPLSSTAAKLDAQILDRKLQTLNDQIESQKALIVFLQNQYKLTRGRLLEVLGESHELRDMVKLYHNFVNTLKAQKNPSREEWRLIVAYDRATALIEPRQTDFTRRISMGNAPPDVERDIPEIEERQHADVTIIKASAEIPRSISNYLDEYPNMEALMKFPLFSKFPKDVVEQVSLASYEMRRKQGQTLLKKGKEGTKIYFLLEGTVSVVVNDKGITYLQPVTFFGELGVCKSFRKISAYVDNRQTVFKFKRTATVMAKTNCVVLVVTKQKLAEIVTQNNAVKILMDEFTADKEAWWKQQQYIKANENFGAEFISEIAREEIKKVGVFSTASDSFCDTLAMRIKCLIVKPKETIVKIGEESDAMYFILKGSVEVGPTGAINAEISSGSFFGEVGVLLNMKRTASIRAKEESNVFKLSKKDLDEVVALFPYMKSVLKVAADERFELFKKRSAPPTDGSARNQEDNIPDQFDLEVGSQSLAKLSLFKSIEKSVLTELAMKMARKTWEAGEFIIKADELGTSMFFLAAGKADVITAFGELLDSVTGPSAYFGEVAIIEQVPRTASIKCTSTCSTYELRKEDFQAVITKYPDIEKLIKATADERMQNYLMRSVLA
ncbi:UNVERIFIED_CONTAM: hypothetical protein HDU68_001555 [Siphonaria sp. JEL0065]|nr:hypothetical protein HDU68_001555 [Siphonaria sp. JEL0065]